MLITECKITEIFLMADKIRKFLDTMIKKYTFKNPEKRRDHRDGKKTVHHDNIPRIWIQVLQTILPFAVPSKFKKLCY